MLIVIIVMLQDGWPRAWLLLVLSRDVWSRWVFTIRNNFHLIDVKIISRWATLLVSLSLSQSLSLTMEPESSQPRSWCRLSRRTSTWDQAESWRTSSWRTPSSSSPPPMVTLDVRSSPGSSPRPWSSKMKITKFEEQQQPYFKFSLVFTVHNLVLRNVSFDTCGHSFCWPTSVLSWRQILVFIIFKSFQKTRVNFPM